MGIEKLAGRLPRKKKDYLKVRRTKGAAMVVRIDAAGALWICAYRSKETYAFGDFFAAWARWQRLLQQWKMVDFKGGSSSRLSQTFWRGLGSSRSIHPKYPPRSRFFT